jgi:hypothetical protein
LLGGMGERNTTKKRKNVTESKLIIVLKLQPVVRIFRYPFPLH